MDSSNVVAVNDHPNRSQDEINFDLDIYFILVRFLINDDRMKMNNIKIWPLMGIAPENFDYWSALESAALLNALNFLTGEFFL